MNCALSKWFISRSLDSNKEIPGFIRNHLSKCGTCREFLQFSQTLEEQAAKDAALLLQETPDTLLDKVKQTAIRMPVLRRQPRMKRTFIPVVSVSLAAVLVVLFFVVRPNPSPPPTPVPGSSVLTPYESFLFGRDSNPGGSLKNLASQMESPFGTEWQSIQKKVKTAADSLKSRLDLKIQKREN